MAQVKRSTVFHPLGLYFVVFGPFKLRHLSCDRSPRVRIEVIDLLSLRFDARSSSESGSIWYSDDPCTFMIHRVKEARKDTCYYAGTNTLTLF